MTDYQKLLGECISFHGHPCMGQALGVRIGFKGLELAGPFTPLAPAFFDYGIDPWASPRLAT